MVAKSDPADYGTLQVFTMTTLNADGTRQRNRQVDGPLIVSDNIQSNAEVSKELTLLNGTGGGSRVLFGNLLVIPIDQGLLYVRPYYVSADKADAVPELRRVVVCIGDRIAVSDTLNSALSKLFPNTNIPTAEIIPDAADNAGTSSGNGTTTPVESRSPSQLIADALGLFTAADDALKTGGAAGLTTYQEKTAAAEDLIRQAQSLLGAAGASPTTTAPAAASPTTTTAPGG